MTHGPEHQLEEAHHAGHDPFDRRVAMTMVVIAAVLAAVRVLGHRAHNDVLQYQTREANQWAYFQAKEIRRYTYEMAVKLPVLVRDTADPHSLGGPAAGLIREWEGKIAKWKEDTEKIEEQAREYQRAVAEAHHRGDRLDLGELGVELALVLCSVAILTRRRGFWYGGMAVGLVGVAVALSAYLPHGH